MRVQGRGGSGSNSGRVGLLGFLLLVVLVLLFKEAICRSVDSPQHVVFAPMVSVLPNLLLLLFSLF